MSADESASSKTSGDRRLPDEGSLLHVTPSELVGRLVELRYTGRCVFYVGAVEGEVGLYEGQVVDARALGDFGPPALFRMLGATTGSYRLDRRVTQSAPPQSFGAWPDLLEEHQKHRARLTRAADAVGGLSQVWSLRPVVVRRHLAELPDQINPLLRRIDGRRSVAQVITETPLEEPLVVRALGKLLSLGVLALPDAVAEESGPGRSPLSTSLTPATERDESEPVPVIGSDIPVRPQWFDDEHRPQDEREEVRSAVMGGSLEPSEALEPSLDDAVLPVSDPDGDPIADDDTLTNPRPLPGPPDIVEASAQDGRPRNVSLTTWSSQGEPPPLFVGEAIASDEDRGEVDRWLGAESSFFSTPPTEAEEPLIEKPKPVPPPKEPTTRERLVAAAVLLAGGALVGYLAGQSCSPSTAESLSDAPAASTVDG